jgi:hypothetical protein
MEYIAGGSLDRRLGLADITSLATAKWLRLHDRNSL